MMERILIVVVLLLFLLSSGCIDLEPSADFKDGDTKTTNDRYTLNSIRMFYDGENPTYFVDYELSGSHPFFNHDAKIIEGGNSDFFLVVSERVYYPYGTHHWRVSKVELHVSPTIYNHFHNSTGAQHTWCSNTSIKLYSCTDIDYSEQLFNQSRRVREYRNATHVNYLIASEESKYIQINDMLILPANLETTLIPNGHHAKVIFKNRIMESINDSIIIGNTQYEYVEFATLFADRTTIHKLSDVTSYKYGYIDYFEIVYRDGHQ